jgi:cytochrome c5
VQKHDLIFMKHFAQLIAALAVLTVILIVGAWFIYARLGLNEESPARIAETNARIAPVAGVFAGETGRSAMLAAQEVAKAAMAAKVAFDGALDGALIYDRVCAACHLTGAGGAPAPTAAAWAPRKAKGLDTLVANAIDGFRGDAGLMPAKGGRPDLTDEQVRVTVEYMLDKYK